LEFLGKQRTYRPVLRVPPFGQGPGDMAAFAAIYEIICNLNHMLMVGSYFGPQEDLGTVCILDAFTEDADKIARTALEDASVSDAGIWFGRRFFRAIGRKLFAFMA
jgi:hypothetical protein